MSELPRGNPGSRVSSYSGANYVRVYHTCPRTIHEAVQLFKVFALRRLDHERAGHGPVQWREVACYERKRESVAVRMEMNMRVCHCKCIMVDIRVSVSVILESRVEG